MEKVLPPNAAGKLPAFGPAGKNARGKATCGRPPSGVTVARPERRIKSVKRLSHQSDAWQGMERRFPIRELAFLFAARGIL
jgi:hypothetical protein